MPLALRDGEVLRGRYQIRERIGKGGAGSIYLADDLRLEGRLCALKEVEYDRTLPDNILEEARQQFFREATILARFDHANLPKVSDFFSSGLRDYLVMDYVPGDDLRTIMLEARHNNVFLPESRVLGWARQLMDALLYLHGQDPPIVHRDIKPSNLKVTPSGVLKLVDFGLVKVLSPDQEMTITVIQGQGTALYTPLEQYGSDDTHTDRRSDIYSMGEGGERWSEGGMSDEATLPSIPAGKYYLRIEPESSSQIVNYSIQVYRDVPQWSFFIIALVTLCLLPILMWWRSGRFEAARWSESDSA